MQKPSRAELRPPSHHARLGVSVPTLAPEPRARFDRRAPTTGSRASRRMCPWTVRELSHARHRRSAHHAHPFERRLSGRGAPFCVNCVAEKRLFDVRPRLRPRSARAPRPGASARCCAQHGPRTGAGRAHSHCGARGGDIASVIGSLPVGKWGAV